MPIYFPHNAHIYNLNTSEVYEASGQYIPGHLTLRQYSADLIETGINQRQIAEYIFKWEDRNKVKQGDRLLVDGEFWHVISPVQSRNEVYILRESRVQLEIVNN